MSGVRFVEPFYGHDQAVPAERNIDNIMSLHLIKKFAHAINNLLYN
jgi:hypothetical protein